MMGMAGSLLPSHNKQTLEPVTCGGFTFKIEPVEIAQTYILLCNQSPIAAHPNGHSLKELVTRIVYYRAGHIDAARVEAQWDYILDCGGMAQAKGALEYYLGGKP